MLITIWRKTFDGAGRRNPDALQELKRAAALKPDWFELQIELGIACQHAGDSDGAVAAFSEAIKLRPQDPEAYNDLGLALVQKGDAEGAIPKFQDGGPTESGRRHVSRESSDRLYAARRL